MPTSTVVVDPADYDARAGRDGGATAARRRSTLRKALAAKAYRAHRRLRRGDRQLVRRRRWASDAPAWRAFGGKLAQALRYGENPHQTAAFYAPASGARASRRRGSMQGKELSYNNINDTDAAFELRGRVRSGRSAAVAIIKHANPCGVADGATLAEAYRKALALRSGLAPSAASSR